MAEYIIAIVIGYFIGNIAFSYLAGKALKNIDIREHGSGNAGATNTFRVLGAKAGVIVFACDILKGMLAVCIGLWLTGTRLGGMLSGAAAILGHNWPVILNFKGGKGIASSFGLILVLFPKIGVILFVIAVAVIFISHYVSLGSISAAVLFPVFLVIFGEPWEICLIGTVLALIAVLRHKDNIIRLSKGEENKFSLSQKSGR